MNINQVLYFAPGIPFIEVDWVGAGFPAQFQQRIHGYYIEPAKYCADAGHAFAAGVLLVSAIDALARLKADGSVGERFIGFARASLPSFLNAESAQRLYYDFRNGLVHEGRIKSGGQFSFDYAQTVSLIQNVLLINPHYLADELTTALDGFVALLGGNNAERRRVVGLLKQDLGPDIQFAAP
jgi:hypothetical protein